MKASPEKASTERVKVKKIEQAQTQPNHRPIMASIHTARNIVGNDKTVPLFTLKGLSNLVPSTITALNIQGIPLERQVAYTQYSSNIASFIYASATGKTITISPSPLGLLNGTNSLPLPQPTVSFTLQKPLNTDQSDKFINILGPGASKTQSGKTTIYHAPALPTANLTSVVKLSTPFFNAGRDSINPKGARALKFLDNAISLFLEVHSYSAFREEDKDSIIIFEQLLARTYGTQYFPAVSETKDKDGNITKTPVQLEDKSYSSNEFNKRPREDEMDTEEVTSAEKFVKSAEGFFRFRGNETVVKAHPAKKNVSNIGSSKQIPASPGLIFPYFHGLIQPDGVFMNSVLLRRFYQLMGSTHDLCQQTYVDLRHGVNSLASTARGMEMCHILLGVELALETQSRCFLIIDKGQYHGFSLLGARFAIFCNTKWNHSASEEDFLSAIKRMDPHESAIEDMIKVLADLKTKDQYSGSLDKSLFREPKMLVECFDKLKLNVIPDDEVREMDRCVRNLNYMGTGYLSKNPQMISEMLDTIASNKSIELGIPTYIPSIRSPVKDRLFAILSQFGPEAPSFWNDRGKEITCKPIDKSVSTMGGKRKIGDSDDFGNMPIRILITPKPLLVAVKDMERVLDKGRVKMDIDERAGRYRNITVEHDETRKRMWKGLINACASSDKKPRVNSDDMDDEEGGVDLDDVLFKLIGN